MPTQSSFQASLMPSHNTHTLFGVFSLISSFVFYPSFRGNSSLSFSLRCEDTHTRENREQAKQRRTSSSLSLSPPHTDHRRIARSPCQNATESPIIFIPVEGPFFQVNLSDGPSRSLSHSLSVPSISLSLYIEVFFLRTSFSSLTNR